MLPTISELILTLSALLAFQLQREYQESWQRNLSIPLALTMIAVALLLAHFYTAEQSTIKPGPFLMSNLWTLFRSLFLGVLGLAILERMDLDTSFTVRILPAVTVAFGFVVYSWSVFVALDALSLKTIVPPVIPPEGFATVCSASIAAAIVEEQAFRLGLLSLLVALFEKHSNKWFLGVVLSSIVWTFAHLVGDVPIVAKSLQIFPFGLVLGWLYHRYGYGTALIAHVGANTLMLASTIGVGAG